MFHSWVKIEGAVLDFTVPSFNATINDPLAAAIEAVNSIVENYPPPYNLLASGGIDSQAMIYAWKKSNHPFNVYTVRYNETYNLHDIETLPLFCEQEGIPYRIIDFDYFKFLEEEYDSIANRYQCSSPQISMHIKMSSFFDEGTCIYSGNSLNDTGANLSNAILGLYRFSQTPEGKNTIPYFFLHTPELAYSFKQAKFVKKLKYSRDNVGYGQDPRVKIYHSAGFPIIPQAQKFTGFEKFKEHYDSHDYVLKDNKNRLRWHNKASHRPFDWLFRYPYEDKFGPIFLNYRMNRTPYTIK
jgi:hypothetical protein